MTRSGRRHPADLRRRARRLAASGLALAALLLGASPPGAAADRAKSPGDSPPSAHVHVEGGRLTVDVHDVELVDLLGQIAAQAGFELTTTGTLGRLTIAFTGASMEEGLRRLVRDHELMLVYRPAGSDPREATLMEVRVFAVAPARSAPGAPRDPPRTDPASLAEINQIVAARDAERGVPRLAEILATAPAMMVRARAAWALGRMGGPEVGPILARALRDEAPYVRAQTAYVLARAEGSRGIPALSAVLLGDEDASVRRAAVRALAGLKEPEATAPALIAATADPDESVSEEARRALRRLGVTSP